MNKETRTPRRGPMGHGPGMRGATEKAKDFKGAMKRLFKELNIYKILLTVSFTLAIVGAILSISAPNILSKLTDEISEGLKPNKDILEKEKLEYNERGLISINDKCETNIEKVYAGGDLSEAKSTVCRALGSSRKAAQAIMERLEKNV